MITTYIFFTNLKSALPSVFTREEAAKHLGGLLSAKTLNNIDYMGEGPEVRVRVGKKIGYERETFVQWLRQYGLHRS